VRENSRASYIIRTAWLYGKHGGNFVHTMLQLMKEQDAVSADGSLRASPTWTHDLALAIAALIRVSENGKHIPYGIYHYTSEGAVTQLDFARKIYALGRELNLLDRDCAVNPRAAAGAAEGGYLALDKKRIRTALHIKIPAWDASLRNYMASLPREQPPDPE
jgi:dTDP-4-dehydrorhamnose reductase